MARNLIGKVLLGQYRVDAFIASGGMGEVYQVYDLKRNVPLAMKVLHDELAEDPSVLKRFRREANALKNLAHPNIVPFYGMYQTEDLAFLLEAYIDGPSLKEILKERQGRPLGVEETLSYLKALSAALGYAHVHEPKVVHCDIKPGNVMVDRGGSIYLTDFGIARYAESTTTTLAGAGTAGYMAPEQIRGEAVSAATDVYALGVMLYEMLTGRRPFRGDEKGTESGGATANERVRYAHLRLQPPDPRTLNPAISEALAQVILKALAKEPGQRYQSTLELYQAAYVAAGVAPETIGRDDVPPPSPPTRDWRDILRSKGFLAVAGGLLLVALLFIIIALGDGPNPPPAGSPLAEANDPGTAAVETVFAQLTETAEVAVAALANTPTTTFTPPAVPTDTPTLASSPTDTPTVPPPAPRYIVFTKGKIPATEDDDLYIAREDGRQVSPFVTSPCDEREPAISSDGRSVAYQSDCSGSDDIWVVDVNGATRNNLTNTSSQDEREPDWSPDGAQIVYKVSPNDEGVDKNGDIWMMNANGTGAYSLRIEGRAPAWSPDGNMIAYMFKDGVWQIYVYEISSGRSTKITDCDVNCRWPDWSPDSRYVIFNKTVSRTSMDPDGIWYVLASGGELVPVISDGPVGRPSWSVDSLIAFNSPTGIDVIRQDGTQRETLVSMIDAWAPSW